MTQPVFCVIVGVHVCHTPGRGGATSSVSNHSSMVGLAPIGSVVPTHTSFVPPPMDATIGRGAEVWASIVESATVEDGATVGPFSHLRPGSVVGPGASVGNFAELKNTRLGPGVKQHHVSYLGDAELGAGTNVGAGTITANYDGSAKHRTTIGERVFLGVDTMLRAPVTLGDDSRTGAGAVVTRDVPAGKLAVGIPARIREPRQKPGGDAAATEPDPNDPSPAQGASSETEGG